MPRIDEMPEYRAKLPRTTHDLSHKFGFTASTAHLLPVFHDFLNAGETCELGFDFNLRTQPLQSAAMVDIKCHTEYFFVPMQLLYEPFGSWYYGIMDNFSSNFLNTTQSNLPLLNFADVRTFLVANRNNFLSNEIAFECVGNQAVRLLEHLNMNPWLMFQDAGSPDGIGFSPNVFPYQLLAYHCIYQYYYRLDNRERFNNKSFNWDRFYGTTLVGSATVDDFDSLVESLFHLHYRPYGSDYFTDVKVSPIVDVLNLNNKLSFDAARNWLTRSTFSGVAGSREVVVSGTVGNDAGVSSGGASGLSRNVSDPSQRIQTNFGFGSSLINRTDGYPANGLDINTANIRSMFATEKLWSVTGRARKHYDDQTLAHFGFKVPHDVKHEITCFGHDVTTVHIGEVISTASTSDASLGEIAGKGYASQSGRKHKFLAPCHGVVMIIQSFVPDVTYSETFGKENVFAERADLYQPEYDHLGMQPLFGYEVGINLGSTFRNRIVGWQYRYEQWKRRYNRVTCAFQSGFNSDYEGSLNSWMLDFRPYNIYLTNYVQGLIDNKSNFDSYGFFLHYPMELDQLMLVHYVGSFDDVTSYVDISKIYDGDPFVVDSFVHAKKISTMSDYSLPRLDS